MPIYEYRCGSCGFEKEHLQKVSDAPVAACPACGGNVYTKLISAAGFQLKGSGWYATDFKNGAQPKPKPDAEAPAAKSETPASTAPAASAACPACTSD
ncbi:MAG: zinc ribbon domain-containing protein [Nitrosospira sp.]|nr:zinc ribbon domain-containing protein [Nitrosospira sp.]MDN5836006.1 zinc ribbon domain-containing protein [Nitrosospira sp.]MDN5881728.1 zinc ribbon domain-containing protein [Nitrosospira sp.]MDN5936074.1 zinc ribbon domain-containing protein [Nitrosospira sp.]